MKKLFNTIICFLAAACVRGQDVQPFPLSDVRLLESPFLSAQQTDAKYILSLNEDRLLAPYLKDAGLTPLAPNYGNWESQGLDGHIAGHYLSAVAQLYAATGDTVFRGRLDYMLGWLEKCQDRNGDGYVGGIPDGKGLWREIAAGRVGAIWSRWAPWYNLHKLFSGLEDVWLLTGDERARRIVVGLADWCLNLTSGLSDGQMQQMLGNEQGGMNEVLANLSVITGDRKYLTLARRFSHQAILRPLERGEDSLTGLHANTQIPKVTGFMRIGMLSGDSSWQRAAKFFWNEVTQRRSVVFGGNSVREHFNPVDDFSGMLESREGPETCNSYNMLKLTKLLFLSDARSSYMDYYERTLYNHILSSEDPKGGFVYFTPIRPNHYRVYSSAQESFWCCVGTGMENHGKYGELLYAHSKHALYVSLFIPSVLDWREKGLVLTQRTSFPFAEQTTLVVAAKRAQRFVLRLRRPSWLGGEEIVRVNGKQVKVMVGKDGYLSVDRMWKDKDSVDVSLPMRTRAEGLPDGSHWVAFLRGPVVLAAPTGTEDLAGLWADSSRWGHIARGRLVPLDKAPMLAIDDLSTAKPPAGLVPFFQIHESRYILYWPYARKADIPGIEAEMKEKEEEKLRKEAATVDVVYPGEQQPEADHGWKGENTAAGFFRERHYRSAKGWFSYRLANTGGLGKEVSFTYYGADGPKRFEVLVNGKMVAGVRIAAGGEREFKDYVIMLPDEVAREKEVTVMFKAEEGSAVAGIYEVRLQKKYK
ncbi:MAG: glycoside hydrolase family 127 protein [Bacteroidetes bacterium]|nr:glycoside hydrolase family 127 protein [Bacteroidota bacterium]